MIKRDKNYYLDSFDSSIQFNSGRSLPIDDHFLNLKNNEKIKKYDTILTGCYADWLFKGIALDRKQHSLFFIGRLPLYKLKAFHYNFFAKRTLLKEKYEKMIREREDQIFFDKKSVELLDYTETVGLKEGLIEMWDWAQKQPTRKQQKFDTYEVDKGLYSFWK